MIAGATAAEAGRQFRSVVQVAMSGVGRSVVGSSMVPPETDLYVTDQLVGRRQAITVKLRMRTLLIHDPSRDRHQRWLVRPVRYDYKLDGEDGRELLAYHWHPSGFSHERRPHLHWGAGMDYAASEWQKAHLLTGAISPVAILEPCLAVPGVPARRSEWPDAFAHLTAAFAESAPTDQAKAPVGAPPFCGSLMLPRH